MPDTGVNVNRVWMLETGAPVQEVERGGPCTGGGKESPDCFNWRGGRRWIYRRV